jgi:hypothetical protein
VFKALVYALVGLLAFVLHGLAIALLWKWFIVTALGLPAIGIVSGLGLRAFVHLVTPMGFSLKEKFEAVRKPEESDEDIMLKVAIGEVLVPLLAMLGGWVLTLFS